MNENIPIRFIIQDVFALKGMKDRPTISGKLEVGMVSIGDELVLEKDRKKFTIEINSLEKGTEINLNELKAGPDNVV
ncbi:hypothetical protein [Reichenbachiella sp.]|uniref:hypothetical protein n=1 Tax=Reichenbachiella sp. TaxID=2184521 RepID=UPI0032992287